MGTCIGANGLILLREPASLPLPRHCDVYSRALHCSDIHVYGSTKEIHDSSEILTTT